MFLIVYVVIPIVLLLAFGFKKPKLAPLSIIICPILDILLFLDVFLYYEGRPFVILFTAIQLLFVIPLSLLIRFIGAKRNR